MTLFTVYNRASADKLPSTGDTGTGLKLPKFLRPLKLGGLDIAS